MIGTGIGFMANPNPIITIFGFKPTIEILIRVLGILSFVAGIQCVVAAKNNLIRFFKISIWGRLFFAGEGKLFWYC